MSSPGGLIPQPVEVFVSSEGRELLRQVFQTTPISVGRLSDNDIVIPFDVVSRHHCEIRYEDGRWSAVDLKSTNGLTNDRGESVREIRLESGGRFSIGDYVIQISSGTVPQELTKSFAEIPTSRSVIPDRPARIPSEPAPHSVQVPAPAVSERPPEPMGAVPAEASAEDERPVLDLAMNVEMTEAYPGVEQMPTLAMQMTLVWHDQVLEVTEFPVGAALHIRYNGASFRLGRIGARETKIKMSGLPPGLAVTPESPMVFAILDTVMVHLRYVPKSLELPFTKTYFDPVLVNPIYTSLAVHGTVAVAVLLMPGPQEIIRHEEPVNHFAKILVPPPPPPEPVPTPTPVPTPEPSPTPPPVVEEAPKPTPPPVVKVKPPPEEKLKKVVVMKKIRKIALAKKEDPGPRGQPEAPKTPPPVQPAPPREAPPAPPKEVAEAAPKAQPVDVKSVGTLAALSLLKAGPNSNLKNVESLQISRAPASAKGDLLGPQAVKGTGEIISNLSHSATGGGRGDGSTAIASNNIKGYAADGISGKTGRRKIKGSVLGGATYTELSKNEGLTREQVMAVVQKHQAQFQQCYERSLMDNPDLAGRADFEWQIRPDGNVTSVAVKQASLSGGETLLECVKKIFAGMKFPAAKNGESTTPTIGLPFGRL